MGYKKEGNFSSYKYTTNFQNACHRVFKAKKMQQPILALGSHRNDFLPATWPSILLAKRFPNFAIPEVPISSTSKCFTQGWIFTRPFCHQIDSQLSL